MLTRLAIAGAGLAAILWASSVLPVFWREDAINGVAAAVTAGQSFRAEVLAAVDVPDADLRTLRASTLNSLAMIRLRAAEDALRSAKPERIDKAFESAERINDEASARNPSNSFLWFARFWLSNMRRGFSADHLAYLRLSYRFGRNEGWIAERRNRFALASYSALPPDLAELAVAEFVSLVRWDFINSAASIAAAVGPTTRAIVFPQLKDLSEDQRRRYAARLYQDGIDDVLVPGVDPPKPEIPMPVLPPGTGECRAC